MDPDLESVMIDSVVNGRIMLDLSKKRAMQKLQYF